MSSVEASGSHQAGRNPSRSTHLGWKLAHNTLVKCNPESFPGSIVDDHQHQFLAPQCKACESFRRAWAHEQPGPIQQLLGPGSASQVVLLQSLPFPGHRPSTSQGPRKSQKSNDMVDCETPIFPHYDQVHLEPAETSSWTSSPHSAKWAHHRCLQSCWTWSSPPCPTGCARAFESGIRFPSNSTCPVKIHMSKLMGSRICTRVPLVPVVRLCGICMELYGFVMFAHFETWARKHPRIT